MPIVPLKEARWNAYTRKAKSRMGREGRRYRDCFENPKERGIRRCRKAAHELAVVLDRVLLRPRKCRDFDLERVDLELLVLLMSSSSSSYFGLWILSIALASCSSNHTDLDAKHTNYFRPYSFPSPQPCDRISLPSSGSSCNQYPAHSRIQPQQAHQHHPRLRNSLVKSIPNTNGGVQLNSLPAISKHRKARVLSCSIPQPFMWLTPSS